MLDTRRLRCILGWLGMLLPLIVLMGVGIIFSYCLFVPAIFAFICLYIFVKDFDKNAANDNKIVKISFPTLFFKALAPILNESANLSLDLISFKLFGLYCFCLMSSASVLRNASLLPSSLIFAPSLSLSFASLSAFALNTSTPSRYSGFALVIYFLKGWAWMNKQPFSLSNLLALLI